MKFLKLSFFGTVAVYASLTCYFSWLAWRFPIQKVLALRAFKKYTNTQGAEKSDIRKMQVFKDYKRDGYIINVWYKSQPSIRYEYKWFIETLDIMRFVYIDNLLLNIYDATDTHIEVHNKVVPKYPPL